MTLKEVGVILTNLIEIYCQQKDTGYQTKRSMITLPLFSAPFVLGTSLSVGGELVTNACILVTKIQRTAAKGSEQKLES